eukprot:gene22909-31152_t
MLGTPAAAATRAEPSTVPPHAATAASAAAPSPARPLFADLLTHAPPHAAGTAPQPG